jgi:hypothetical protein
MQSLHAFNLQRRIDPHRHLLNPPAGNRHVFDALRCEELIEPADPEKQSPPVFERCFAGGERRRCARGRAVLERKS